MAEFNFTGVCRVCGNSSMPRVLGPTPSRSRARHSRRSVAVTGRVVWIDGTVTKLKSGQVERVEVCYRCCRRWERKQSFEKTNSIYERPEVRQVIEDALENQLSIYALAKKLNRPWSVVREWVRKMQSESASIPTEIQNSADSSKKPSAKQRSAEPKTKT